MSRDAKTKRVVVIGAGASGIGAARTLSAGGAEVIILEGRDRIGGRMRKHCLTKNLMKSSGLEASADHFVNIQLGANWIHGMEAATNPMFEVAQKLGLELHQTSSDDDPGDDVILFDSGDFTLASKSNSDNISKVGYSRVSKEDYHESLSRYEWIKEYVDHIQFNYEKEDISLQAAFDLALKASESEIFGPCSAAQRRCLNWMYDRVSIDLGAHISKVSLNCYAEGVSDGQGGEALVKHIGYSGILDHLATEFPLDIRLNRQVASIAVLNATPSEFGEPSIFDSPSLEELEKVSSDLQKCVLKGGRFVSVTCTDGEVFYADAVVVTVPVGALQAQSISFVPRAPSVISSVCASLKLGLMNLVWLWYPHVFWPEECNFLGVARDRESVEGDSEGAEDNTVVKFSTFLVPPVFDNFGVRQPVLMCQIVGPYATTIESMSDADIAAEATATLRRMFGAQTAVPDALGCAHSSWGSDPNARGSWSYFPYRPQTTSADMEIEVVENTASSTSESVRGSAEVVQGGASESEEKSPEMQTGCVGQASGGMGVVWAATSSRDVSAALAEPPQSVLHPVGENLGSEEMYTNTTSGASSPTTGPATTTTGAGLSPLSRPLSVHTTVYSTNASTNTNTTTTAGRSALAGRSPHLPLRSVTIAEAASLVVPYHTTRAAQAAARHARRYSSTGYTSEGSDVSTDSDDSDSDSSDDEMPHERHDLHRLSHPGGVSSSDEGVLHRSDEDILSSHVCYASEAMSVLNRGTVHGAYLSGIREATKILAFLDELK